MPEGILDGSAFEPHSYDALIAAGTFSADDTSPARYRRALEAYRTQSDVQVIRVTYRSGPFAVKGLIVRPVAIKDGGHPLILYNRGGYREFSKPTVLTVNRTLIPLALQNQAVVYAACYRGVDGGEGRDEFGGSELEDVLSLLAIGRADPAWDLKHSVMIGHSRGGMMTALALKNGARVKAAVLSAAVTDITAWARERPQAVREMLGGNMPDNEQGRLVAVSERSAICWPQALRVPVLLLHGEADTRVSASQTIRLAKAFSKTNVPHDLVLYPGDDHAMTRNWDDALSRMGAWMRDHV